MPLLLVPAHHPTALMLIGLVLVVAGALLAVLGYRRLRRFDAEPHDFHGNPASDRTGFRRMGATLILMLGLILGLILGPAFLLLAR